ncbi:MAG: hypothetical protein ACYDAL_14110 [Candidatus Dormibacteraceae bacterium]
MCEELAAAADAVSALLPLHVESRGSIYAAGRAIGRLEALAAAGRAYDVRLPTELAERLQSIWNGLEAAAAQLIALRTSGGGVN